MLVCLHLKKCELFGPKTTKPWSTQKWHGENLPYRNKLPLFAPDWFCQPYSRQSKNTQFRGVLRGQFATANVRAEQSGEGRDRHCFQFRYTPLPGRQTVPICLSKSMMVAVPTHARAVKNADIQFQRKRGCCPERLHPLINYLDLYLSISSRILNSCSCSSDVFAERNS